MRQDLAQAQRNRALFLLCCKLLLAAMVLAGGYVGGRKAYLRFFLENPDLFLNEIRVSTNGALTREQIIQTVGLVEGRNIFTFDLGEARSRFGNCLRSRTSSCSGIFRIGSPLM